MKKTRRSLIVAVAVMMVFASLSMLSVNTQAILPDATVTSDTIYYFNDYYPTIDEYSFSQAFQSYDVIYDHQWINSSMFTTLIRNGYFDDLSNCVVVIDIKTFKPDEIMLDLLFTDLKARNCRTIFVTKYDQLAFTNQSFISSLDLYFKTDFSVLRAFAEWMIDELYEENNTLNNTTIFLDRRFVNPDNFEETSNNVTSSEYPFVRMLLDVLYDRLNMTCNQNDYGAILTTLKDTHNTNIIVHSGSNSYIDARTGNIVTATTIEYFETNGYSMENVCAAGFLALETDFYSFLDNAQSYLGEGELPIYVIQVDPVTFGEDGLDVVLFGGGYGVASCETTALLELLSGIL